MRSVSLLVTVFLQALVVSAVVHVRQDVNTTSEASYGNDTTYTTVYNSTVTVSVTHSSATSTTTTAGASRPTIPFTVIAIRPGTPIHQLRVNANAQRFYLGNRTATYCPVRVQELGGCPPGDTTAFGFCAMVSPVTSGTHSDCTHFLHRTFWFRVDRRYMHYPTASLAIRRLILLCFRRDLALALSNMSRNTAGTSMHGCSLIAPTRLGLKSFRLVRPRMASGKCFSL